MRCGKLPRNVTLYTLTNKHGLVLKVQEYGAIVTELWVPDRTGKLADVVIGFDTVDEYLKDNQFYGAIVGRVANRVRHGKFELAGKAYALATNDPPHHLHGGPLGFDKVHWSGEARETPEGPSVVLTYVSRDGDEGYPGTLMAKTVYTLTHSNELKVEMSATTDATTLVNLAHHGYWNLGGIGSGTILDHELTLRASHYTPGDPVVPTGVIQPVAGTPFDFTEGKAVGRDFAQLTGSPVGYDHNFVVDGPPDVLREVARLKDPKSGRVLTLFADQPGVQFYSGNFLTGLKHGKGASYPQHSALCLETQKFPDAVNVPAWRDQVVLEPGQTYGHTMIHRFSAE